MKAKQIINLKQEWIQIQRKLDLIKNIKEGYAVEINFLDGFEYLTGMRLPAAPWTNQFSIDIKNTLVELLEERLEVISNILTKNEKSIPDTNS